MECALVQMLDILPRNGSVDLQNILSNASQFHTFNLPLLCSRGLRSDARRNYLRYDVPVTHSHLDHNKWLLVNMPRMQSPDRDICISFVSSPPLSHSDPACCISPSTKDTWDVLSCHLHLCIFVVLYFCILLFVYCIISRTTWFCILLIYISLFRQLKHFLQSCFSFRETKT